MGFGKIQIFVGFGFAVDGAFHEVIIQFLPAAVQSVGCCQGVLRKERPFDGCPGLYGPVLVEGEVLGSEAQTGGETIA